MKTQISVGYLCGAVGMDCEVRGNAERVVARPAPIDASTPDSVTFYSRLTEDACARIGASGAGVVVCTPEAAATLQGEGERTLLLVSNPRLAFIRIMNRFFAPPRPVGIHPTVDIHPEAKLGNDVYIGPFTYVGKAEIGDGTVIDGHVHIYDKVRIGRHCSVHAGVVIGGSSFALELDQDGTYVEFPQVGGVLIEDNVLVGRSSIIDRGALGDTLVRTGVKIDDLAVIAHNVELENNSVVGCHAVVLGSVVVKSGAWIAPCACIR